MNVGYLPKAGVKQRYLSQEEAARTETQWLSPAEVKGKDAVHQRNPQGRTEHQPPLPQPRVWAQTGAGCDPALTAGVSPRGASSAPTQPPPELPLRHLQTPEDVAGSEARRRVRAPGGAGLGQWRGRPSQAVVLQEHCRQGRGRQPGDHPDGQRCDHSARRGAARECGAGSGTERCPPGAALAALPDSMVAGPTAPVWPAGAATCAWLCTCKPPAALGSVC